MNQTGDYDFYVQMFEGLIVSTVNVELKETPANGLPNHTGLINDISKDGKTDILWRNYNDGTTYSWSMNGGNFVGGVEVPEYTDMAWHPVAMADFNNDGNMDIVWRYHWTENTGWNRIWLMNGNTRLAEVEIERVPDNNWHIVGTGDFNLDGNVDILWRNYASGENVVWKMSGTEHIGNISIETEADLNWRIVGTGDFNGDGKSDILWRNAANGVNAIWFMNGTTVTSKPLVETVTLDWSIKGTGDFNNDGKSDIVWRNNDNGVNVLWLMNGNTRIGNHLDITGASADRNWNIVGKSDPVAIWTAEYFGNKDLAGTPTYTEGFANLTGTLSKNWGTGAPPNTPADNFSARFKTLQYIPAGQYQITASSDDGVRVWVGGQLVINDWTDTAWDRTGLFNSTGGFYPVTIEYKEAGGAASINFSIQPYVAPPTGYYRELNVLSESEWDKQSGDNNQFEQYPYGGGGDQRWKTDDRIEHIYTDLSNAIFGYRVAMTAGYAYDQSYGIPWHAGIDLGARYETPIKAAIGGSVAWINGSGDGYVFVGINSDDNRQWVYGHLKSTSGLSIGKRINADDTVGVVGWYGGAPHLHLEVRNNANTGGTGGAMTDQNLLLSRTVSPLMAYWQWRNR